ncbi:glycosyltransferase [Soonwooa purpurea]
MKFWSFKKNIKQIKKDILFKKSARTLNAQLKDFSFFEKHSFEFKEEQQPQISIIIPVYNQIHFTLNCLYSIFEQNDYISKEIIIVNDCSTDETQNIISKIKGVRLISNDENLGFIKGVNKAIHQAQGEYIYLLNNDTLVQKNYLTSLLEVFQIRSNVGAVGSKLIFKDNSLQEAGCLVFKNQVIVNRGASQSIDAPQFNFLRKVDYASGCSLLFKKNDANGKLNLLNEIYTPAYFEETDLCMRLKHLQGLDVYYQPKSEIVHFENISYTNVSLDKKKLIQKNTDVFYEKWGDSLNNIWKEGDEFYRINDNSMYEKTILIVEEYMPKFDQDSGSNRFTEIVKILIEQNHKIYLLIKNIYHPLDTAYLQMFQDMGVEVIREYLTPKKRIVRVKKQLLQIKDAIDFVWIFRPEGYEFFVPYLSKLGFDAKLIYDMVDLHYLRFQRETDFLIKTNKQLKREKAIISLENNALLKANAVVAISDNEKSIVEKLGVSKDKIFIVSNIHYAKEEKANLSFDERKGIVFIGGFNHKPNVDAVQYLHSEIMPLVWKQCPEISVYIIGGSLPESLLKLKDDRFQILGYQKEIDSYFLESKLFVAPLRYGAGVKGKIGQALEYKLPIVSTTIGVEGMKLTPNMNALVSDIDDPQSFANHIISLYTDENLWTLLHSNSESGLDYFSVKKQKENITKMFDFLS